jgi:hypothetical protein
MIKWYDYFVSALLADFITMILFATLLHPITIMTFVKIISILFLFKAWDEYCNIRLILSDNKGDKNGT